MLQTGVWMYQPHFIPRPPKVHCILHRYNDACSLKITRFTCEKHHFGKFDVEMEEKSTSNIPLSGTDQCRQESACDGGVFRPDIPPTSKYSHTFDRLTFLIETHESTHFLIHH